MQLEFSLRKAFPEGIPGSTDSILDFAVPADATIGGDPEAPALIELNTSANMVERVEIRSVRLILADPEALGVETRGRGIELTLTPTECNYDRLQPN